jgi:hypothetical protein
MLQQRNAISAVRSMTKALLVLSPVGAIGCAGPVSMCAIDPKPNINMDGHSKSLGLVIEQNENDTFVILGHDNLPGI